MVRRKMVRGKPMPFRRADGLWVAQVSSGPRGSRRVVRRTSTDRDEAQRLLMDLLERNAVADSRTTVGAYLRSWLEMSTYSLKASTAETYAIAVKRQLIPHLGGIELWQLAPEHVERMIRDLSATMSPKGIRNALSILGQVLEQAMARGLVRRNVVRLVRPPRIVRVDQDAMTTDQARKIIAAVHDDRLEALWLVTLACGLRQAEVLGLRWRDVDLPGASLRVAVVLERLVEDVDGKRRGRYVLVEPKSPKSRRTVALPPFVVTALRAHQTRQLEERVAAGMATEEGLVFVTEAGRPISGGFITHRWRKLSRAMGLDVTFHGLRHAQATLLVAMGVHPKVVSERLGHATVGISMDIYAGVTRASDVAAARLLEEALG